MPFRFECRVQLFAQRLQQGLVLVVNDVDFGVVGNAFERDVRYAFVNKALADVAKGGVAFGYGAGDFAFFGLALFAVGQQIEGVACAHDAGTG